nr:unnamed protein product [Spirometra erinaceieuropaei]
MTYLITGGHSPTAVTSVLAAATLAKSTTTTSFPSPATSENVPDASSATTPTFNPPTKPALPTNIPREDRPCRTSADSVHQRPTVPTAASPTALR